MLTKRLAEQELKHEYGLDGVRTFPWPNVNAPFGAAYCIVAPKTESLNHVNSPADEDELFIVISGSACVIVGDKKFDVVSGDQIFLPRGESHYVRNDTEVPFHFYTIWWNGEGISQFQKLASR